MVKERDNKQAVNKHVVVRKEKPVNNRRKKFTLVGINAISRYVGYSYGTLTALFYDEHFPMIKIGGQFHADPEMINQWESIRAGNAELVKVGLKDEIATYPEWDFGLD